MIEIQLRHDPQARVEADKLLRALAPTPTEPALTGPLRISDDEGNPLVIVSRLPRDVLGQYRQAALAYPMDTTIRAVGIRHTSRVFGYGAKNVMMKRNGCHTCTGLAANPDAHEGVAAIAPVVRDILANIEPGIVQRDAAAALAVRDDWRIRGTQWTSGIMNDTSPLPYHYDRNNLTPVWSAMVVIRRDCAGGYLSIPELAVNLQCRDGDIVFFPGWHFLHGVTPIRKLTDRAYRRSAVFYAVSRMRDCLSPEEEIANGRRRRTEREADTRPAAERIKP